MQRKNTEAYVLRSLRIKSSVFAPLAVAITLLTVNGISSAAEGTAVTHNTPRYVMTAQNLGGEDPAKVIEVSIWLQLHNRSEFDALTESLYDRNSPNYRHWLKPKDIAARFGPTEEEAKTVRQFFIDHNLTIVKTGPDNFYVRARGTVADVQKAFHVQLNNYRVRDKVVRANVGDPYVEGPAADLVQAVSGLDTESFEHPLIIRQPSTAIPTTATTTAQAASPEAYSSLCFKTTETETFTENADGEFPIATYSGNKVNLASQNSPGCAYTPPVIQAAYNLTGLYKEHDQFDGTGQTIAIIDWCGTPTILNDVNAFSARFGLPQLNPANQQPLLSIIYTATSLCENWDQTEINLDVEWAHAVAPGREHQSHRSSDCAIPRCKSGRVRDPEQRPGHGAFGQLHLDRGINFGDRIESGKYAFGNCGLRRNLHQLFIGRLWRLFEHVWFPDRQCARRFAVGYGRWRRESGVES